MVSDSTRETPGLAIVAVAVLAYVFGGAHGTSAGGQASTPPPVRMGSTWARCDVRELDHVFSRREFPECPVPAQPRRKVLTAVPCAQLEWEGGAMGGGLGCITTCTCFREIGDTPRGLCDVAVCPGDLLCREGYRYLGASAGKAYVDAPKGNFNCWRMSLKKPPQASVSPRR